jgi:hypothetical protein
MPVMTMIKEPYSKALRSRSANALSRDASTPSTERGKNNNLRIKVETLLSGSEQIRQRLKRSLIA